MQRVHIGSFFNVKGVLAKSHNPAVGQLLVTVWWECQCRGRSAIDGISRVLNFTKAMISLRPKLVSILCHTRFRK